MCHLGKSEQLFVFQHVEGNKTEIGFFVMQKMCKWLLYIHQDQLNREKQLTNSINLIVVNGASQIFFTILHLKEGLNIPQF